MRKQISKLIGRRMAFQLLILSALAIFAVSCEKESAQMEVEPETPEAAIKKASENKGNSNAPGDESIATIATEEGFTELVGALVYVDEELETGLVDLFSEGTDQYTVFAPTNEAFKTLYEALGEDVDEITDLDPELVRDVLFYHVTEGRRASNSVVPPVRPRTIETLLGETFSVSKEGVISDIAGQETGIVLPDISASNGIIHVIDGVLLPLDGSNGDKSMEEEVSGKKDDSNAPGNN
ncbi:MAG: fasciclin domain-containing protein, partial [Bacteroidales bacterium]|nr:fasciclin domain-containing protein [Bacteroidales bacterium]